MFILLLFDQFKQRINKMKTLILALLLTVTTAHAGTAFFKYEYISGMNKICVYDNLGSDVAITIASYKLCPVIINV